MSDHNPQAFPQTEIQSNGARVPVRGMDLRDWFAGQAMQGELACQDDEGCGIVTDHQELARRSYSIADAMLEARSGEVLTRDEEQNVLVLNKRLRESLSQLVSLYKHMKGHHAQEDNPDHCSYCRAVYLLKTT